MDETSFASEVNAVYGALYRLAARRVADLRELPSVETLALLTHLAQSGPLTLSEMASHLQRALSTLSAKVAAMESQGLLSRQTDRDDARRALIWLTPLGRETVDQALQVLDGRRLADAGRRLSPGQRDAIVQALEQLRLALSPPTNPDPEGAVIHD